MSDEKEDLTLLCILYINASAKSPTIVRSVIIISYISGCVWIDHDCITTVVIYWRIKTPDQWVLSPANISRDYFPAYLNIANRTPTPQSISQGLYPYMSW